MTRKTIPTLKICARCIIVAGVLGVAPKVWAQTHQEVINGGEACAQYPPNMFSPRVWPNEHYLIGSNASAFCQLRVSSPWPVQKLRWVWFQAELRSGSGALSARLCVYSSSGSTFGCGPATTMGVGSFSFDAVIPPTPLPPDPRGAYVHFSFPANQWLVHYLIPYWQH
jgi:hypothetical protein